MAVSNKLLIFVDSSIEEIMELVDEIS